MLENSCEKCTMCIEPCLDHNSHNMIMMRLINHCNSTGNSFSYLLNYSLKRKINRSATSKVFVKNIVFASILKRHSKLLYERNFKVDAKRLFCTDTFSSKHRLNFMRVSTHLLNVIYYIVCRYSNLCLFFSLLI